MKPMSPIFVGGIALTLAIVNLLTIRVPTGANPIGYLVGFLGIPLLVTIIYTIWYIRRYPKG